LRDLVEVGAAGGVAGGDNGGNSASFTVHSISQRKMLLVVGGASQG